MPLSRIRMIIITISMILAILVLSFTTAINMATFKKNYTESLSSNYQVLAEQTIQKIEYAIKYGKPLSNFYGIEEILINNWDIAPEIEEIQVALPSGKIIYNQEGNVEERSLLPEIKEEIKFKDQVADEKPIVVSKGKKYYVYSPIRDKDQKWIGSLGLVFDEKVVSSKLNQYYYQLLFYLVGIIAFIFVCTIVFAYKIPIVKNNKILKKRILTFVLIVLGGTQLLYGVCNYFMLKNGTLEMVRENTSLTVNIIEKNIEDVIKKGVSYSELYGVGNYMKQFTDYLPEVSKISVINGAYSTQTFHVDENSVDSQYSYSTPLVQDIHGEENYICVVDLSKSFIDQKMNSILLDTITVVLISILFIIEMILFILFYLERKLVSSVNAEEARHTPEQEGRVFVRPVSFLVFLGAFLPTTFIPTLTKVLYQPIFPIPEEFVIALPFSLEFIGALLAFLLSIYLVNRKGWKPIFLLGVVIMIIGALGSAFSWNYITWACARVIAGIGFGTVLTSLHRLAFNPHRIDNREILENFHSGSLAGIIFGAILGSLLAERINYFDVFLIAVPILLFCAIVVVSFLPNIKEKRVLRRRRYFYLKGVRKRYYMNKTTLLYILFIVIPMATLNMFLFYYIPFQMEELELTVSSIGRLMLVHGVFVLYLSPFIAKYSEYLLPYRFLILISALITAIGLYIAGQNQSITYLMIAVLLISFAESLLIRLHLNYMLCQPYANNAGDGNIFSFFRGAELVGKMIGPVIFAIFSIHDNAFIVSGVVIIIFSVIFHIISKPKKEVFTNQSQTYGRDFS